MCKQNLRLALRSLKDAEETLTPGRLFCGPNVRVADQGTESDTYKKNHFDLVPR